MNTRSEGVQSLRSGQFPAGGLPPGPVGMAGSDAASDAGRMSEASFAGPDALSLGHQGRRGKGESRRGQGEPTQAQGDDMPTAAQPSQGPKGRGGRGNNAAMDGDRGNAGK